MEYNNDKYTDLTIIEVAIIVSVNTVLLAVWNIVTVINTLIRPKLE